MARHIRQSDVRNYLLAGLAPTAFALLQPCLVRVSLEQGTSLAQSGRPVARIYFPEPGVVSVVAHAADGLRVEAGVIGPEGMTGLNLLHGVDRSPYETLVEIPCRALSLKADDFRDALRADRDLHDALLRWAHVFQVQLMQTTLCNGRLMVNERLARWLLMCHDRADREDLPLTHEALSLMLGVRRPGITTALQGLERAGALRMRRSVVGIRDRTILLEMAGAGYGVPEAEYRRVFGLV